MLQDSDGQAAALAALQDTLSECQSDITAKDGTISNLNARLAELVTSTAAQMAEVEARDASIAALQEELAGAQQALAAAEQGRAEQAALLQARGREVEGLRARAGGLESELETAQGTLGARAAEILELQERLDHQQAEVGSDRAGAAEVGLAMSACFLTALGLARSATAQLALHWAVVNVAHKAPACAVGRPARRGKRWLGSWRMPRSALRLPSTMPRLQPPQSLPSTPAQPTSRSSWPRCSRSALPSECRTRVSGRGVAKVGAERE